MIHMKKNIDGKDYYNLYIDGKWVESSSGKFIQVDNPFNEEVVGFVTNSNTKDVDLALDAAEKARVSWQSLSFEERAGYLRKLMTKLAENKERLAKLLVLEQGKTYSVALGEVDGCIGYIETALEVARHMTADLIPTPYDEMVMIKKVPYGVTIALCAWNYPLALAGRKLGPALITGNTVVLKPHELTPLATAELFGLIDEVGFPPGVINFVTGDGVEVGQQLVSSPLTRMITVTGSVQAGQAIYKAASPNIANLCLELGGKAPFIVLEDADIDKAVEAAVISRFINCGQICVCADMVLVHENIAKEFTEKLVKRTAELRIGDPFSEDTFMGPKVSRAEVDKLDRIVQETVSQGAKVALGGKRMSGGIFDKGYWYEPTILTGVKSYMCAANEETFGPVFPVMTISSLQEAMDFTNAMPYGLAAYLFTADVKNYMYASEFLEVGTIFYNQGIMGHIQVIHTGQKLSGLGGEDGIYGVDGYLQKRVLYMKL